MAKISGRADDMLIVRGVNVFPTQIEEYILSCQGLAPHYEIEVTREGRMDEVFVRVEARANLELQQHAVQGALLAGKLKDYIGISARVVIVGPGTLPRSAGKAVHVVDRRVGRP